MKLGSNADTANNKGVWSVLAAAITALCAPLAQDDGWA
jgi:hypothetical protein